jgi:cyclic pyranopterin monophosphate synthase
MNVKLVSDSLHESASAFTIRYSLFTVHCSLNKGSMSLTHLDEEGRARMVDVSDKPVTTRTAVASGFVRMAATTIAAIRAHATPKGDPLEVARIAGVMAAKRASDLIPLCHPLPLNHADVELEVRDDGIAITATTKIDSRTGVEMEALTAVSVTALTIYDMCKAMDKAMAITDIRLESKSGGRSVDYQRKVESLESGVWSQLSDI